MNTETQNKNQVVKSLKKPKSLVKKKGGHSSICL